ncbi:MAG: bifunctional pyr operon transcriptional regulator/uracil phosphoribosyltransferase PyrR [Gammaproteobacteria bacterium]
MDGGELREVDTLIDEIAGRLSARIAEAALEDPAMIGIRTGGVWLAARLHERLGLGTPLGELNIAFYRDDFSRVGVHPTVEPSALPFDVDDRDLLLVDDILYTGRTVRAAMNEIFDYGRPRSITLIVLVDRGGRELPIDANVYGQRITLAAGEHVKLLGPDPLRLEICATKP